MTTQDTLKLTANQASLLAALVSLGGLAMSREDWVRRATQHYLRVWPEGSNSRTGPNNAQKSLLRIGLVESTQLGSRKPARLTYAGERLCSGPVPSIVLPPMFGGGTERYSLQEFIKRSAL